MSAKKPSLLFLTCLLALLTGCKPAPSNSSLSNNLGANNPSILASTMATAEPARSITDSKRIVQTADLAGQEIAQQLELSYARASAYKSNECPKLIEFQFSNQSITRQDERFPIQTCDYYVYLRQAEILKIDVSKEVKAELLSPVYFDFANGNYMAPKYDKYTIRLSYDGTRFNPKNFKYDIILTKAKSEATF